MHRLVTPEEAERLLAEFYRKHDEHHGTDVHVPSLGVVTTWCEECREGERYRIEGMREAVMGTLKERGAVTF